MIKVVLNLIFSTILFSGLFLNAGEIMKNGKFEDGLKSWQKSGKVKVIDKDGDKVVEISGNSSVTQYFSFPKDFSGMVELSAIVKTSPEDKLRLALAMSNSKEHYAKPGETSNGYTTYKVMVPVSVINKGNRIWCGWSRLKNPAYIKSISLKTLENYKETRPANKAYVSKVSSPGPGRALILLWATGRNDIGAELQYKESGQNEWKPLATLSPYLDRYIHEGLKAGKTYHYRVRYLSNGGNSDWSPSYGFKTPNWQVSKGGNSYYIDPVNGSDKNQGVTEQKPWKSLKRVSEMVFSPGDKILFKSGAKWNGSLDLRGSGTAEKPIKVSVYGGKKKAVISTVDKPFCVRLKNGQYWNVADLELSNLQTLPANLKPIKKGKVILQPGDVCYAGYARKESRIGFLLELDNFGVASGITIERLYVHDVEGRQVSKENGGIVVRINGKDKPSRFDGLKILDNKIEDVTRSGIVFRVIPHNRRDNWFPSTNVLIQGNELRRIGGDGITPWACDGAVVQNNYVAYSSYGAMEANVGIWPWSSDNTLIQHNTVCFTRKYPGNGDGQGYDIDSNCRNTTLQYNLSYNNEGGMLLICDQSGRAIDSKKEVPTENCYVRYNVSVNDGLAWCTLWADVRNVYIYNNTVISQNDSKLSFLLACWGNASNWKGRPQKNINVFNNVFLLSGNTTLKNPQPEWKFYDNVIWGNSNELFASTKKNNLFLDPRLNKNGPGEYTPGFEKVFSPLPDSPLKAHGTNLPKKLRPAKDYTGQAIPEKGKVTPGAFQTK